MNRPPNYRPIEMRNKQCRQLIALCRNRISRPSAIVQSTIKCDFVENCNRLLSIEKFYSLFHSGQLTINYHLSCKCYVNADKNGY